MKAAAALAVLALAGCATDTWVTPGTGWSRAPDLSVYSAMTVYGGLAREQEMLCAGFAPAAVEARWDDDFAAREAAVEAALAVRHGDGALAQAEAAARPTRNVACPDIPDARWRRHYARLLRLLETRLGLV